MDYIQTKSKLAFQDGLLIIKTMQLVKYYEYLIQDIKQTYDKNTSSNNGWSFGFSGVFCKTFQQPLYMSSKDSTVVHGKNVIPRHTIME